MKKILVTLLATIALLFTLNACLADPNKIDLSTCDHNFDFAKYDDGVPWADQDSRNIHTAWISLYGTKIGDTLPYREVGFNCTVKRDTCWAFSQTQGSFLGDTTANNDCGMESDCGAVVMCHMDSLTSFAVDTRNYDEYHSERINPKLMIDTFSTPALRSEFQHWWPLPRIPWPKGESVAADTTYWRDSTSTSSAL
jgi:hypothetical protein